MHGQACPLYRFTYSPLLPHPVFLDKKKNNGSSNWAREEHGPVALVRQWTYLHLMRWTSVYLDAQTFAGVLTLSATQTPSLPRSFISRGRTRRVFPLLLLTCTWVWKHGPAGHTSALQNVIQVSCSSSGLLEPVPKPQRCYSSFWRLTGMFWGACSCLVENAQAMTPYDSPSMRTPVAHSPTCQILVVCRRCKLLLRTRAGNKCKAVPGKATTD